ncbi:hypothetical protein [Phytohabitans rumicis]|nr:hypothetical protein [Phytohabitans rumicis]
MATRSRLLRGVLTVAGIIGGLFCYFVCQGMFAGYPATTAACSA